MNSELNELYQELSTIPQALLTAFELKEWLKANNPVDFLSQTDGMFYQAAIRHDSQGDTVAMQANSDIVVKYQKKAFAARTLS